MDGGDGRSRTYIACEPVEVVPTPKARNRGQRLVSLTDYNSGAFPVRPHLHGASLSWLSRTFQSRREDFRTALPRGACFTTTMELRTGLEPALHWMKTRVPTPFRRPQQRCQSLLAVTPVPPEGEGASTASAPAMTPRFQLFMHRELQLMVCHKCLHGRHGRGTGS